MRISRFAAAAAIAAIAGCGGDQPTQRHDGGGRPADAAPAAVADDGVLRQLLPGIVRAEAGTIEITARLDRPLRELGNGWDFLLQIVPAKVIGTGANTLVGIFVPPAPATGLVALVRNGTKTFRVEAPGFACTPGQPVNIALSWGRRLTLWRDGVELASTPMDAPPAEELWPAAVEIGRHAPFDPQGLRFSSIERLPGGLDATPGDGFAVDADTTLVAGPGLRGVTTPASRWQRDGGYAVAKPSWRPEAQCLSAGSPATFPLALANLGTASRTAHLGLVLTPLSGATAISVDRDVAIPAGAGPSEVAVALPALASDWYKVAWTISGDGIPALQGTSAIAVYPSDPLPAAGALASFYSVHRPEAWSTAPFTRMGVGSTRAWALSETFLWHRIEPTPGRFRWEASDAYVQSCLDGGMEVLAVLGYPSRWAAVEPSEEHKKRHELAHRPERWKPADLQAWAAYVRAVATRYKGRVRHYEIYNEVNFCPPAMPATFSGGTADYLALQRIAYQEIKRIDPAALVLSSGFSADVNKPMPLEALAGGLAQWCDIFNVHGYSGVEGTKEWVAEWRRQRPGAPVWMTEQMWFQVDDDRRRWWLTAALPLQYAADGYARFVNMGVRECFFDRATASPTRDQWVVAVMNNELRPCTGYAGRAAGAGAAKLDISHRFARSDGSWLTVLGSERGAMAVTLSAAPDRVRDLFGRPLKAVSAGGSVRLEIPDLAWMVSPAPIEVLSAEPLGDAPLVVNAGFEQIDGDIAMGGLAAGKPRGYTLRDRAYDPQGAIRLSARPRTGAHAVELATSGAGRVYLFQNAQIPAAGSYELSGWFRIDTGSPEPYVFLFDQDSGKIHEAKAVTTAGATGFAEVRLIVDLPARNIKPLAVGWGIRGTGAATVDDIAFAPARARFDHARYAAIDLAPAAKLPLGGWAAVLPGLGNADLSALASGEQVFAGRSYAIGGGDHAVVAAGGAGQPNLARRAEIPVGGAAAGLTFLHTAMWVASAPGQQLGRYVITFTDGSTAIHPIVNQRTIADWYKPAADPAVPVGTVVTAADRIPRNLYADRWSNPNPSLPIRSVAIESTAEAALVLVAISRELP